jgi:ABC-type transport system involved in Fe-S cluster assembly fused permease/ATPase subunit
MENIRFGRFKATDDEVIKASPWIIVIKFISNNMLAMDFVGERGLNYPVENDKGGDCQAIL